MIERIDFNGLEIEKENKWELRRKCILFFFSNNLMLFLIF
jgi:hypothetical protein